LKRSTALLSFLFLAAALSANAGLIGTNVTLNYTYEGTSTTDIFAVGPGLEVSCNGGGTGNANVCSILTAPIQAIDIGDNFITYNYLRVGDPAGFAPGVNGFDFQALDLDSHIIAVQLSTTIAGLDASRLTFDTHSIQLDMSSLPLGESDSFTLTIVTNPEPSAGFLAGLGGLLLVSAKYLRKRSSDKIVSCNPQDPASPPSAT
jgi:hypothetical protein